MGVAGFVPQAWDLEDNRQVSATGEGETVGRNSVPCEQANWGSQDFLSELGVAVMQSLSCVRLCDPMGCSTPGFPVLHRLRVCSNSHALSQWCHPATSSSVAAFRTESWTAEEKSLYAEPPRRGGCAIYCITWIKWYTEGWSGGLEKVSLMIHLGKLAYCSPEDISVGLGFKWQFAREE